MYYVSIASLLIISFSSILLKGHCPTPQPSSAKPSLFPTAQPSSAMPSLFSTVQPSSAKKKPKIFREKKEEEGASTKKSMERNIVVFVFVFPCLIFLSSLMRFCIRYSILQDSVGPPSLPIPISTEARKQFSRP